MLRLIGQIKDHSLAHLLPEHNGPKPDEDAYDVEQLIEQLSKAIVSSDELAALEIPQRESFFGTWFRQGDLGFIFGRRGVGKTWLALYLARCLAEGRKCGPWDCQKARRVLYIDGEMPADNIKVRDQSLKEGDDYTHCLQEGDGELRYLSHELLFEKTGGVLNLSDFRFQKAITKICEQWQIEAIFLDNLSCLFSGMAENEADAWEIVLSWLLDLRRKKIAVIILHHSNRLGRDMRGTSRREDAAAWIVKLQEPYDVAIREGEGAKFLATFAKNRQGTVTETQPLEWFFEPDGEKTRVTYRTVSNLDRLLELVGNGLTHNSDIATDMGLSKGTVSKLAAKAVREGKLKRLGTGRNITYELVKA